MEATLPNATKSQFRLNELSTRRPTSFLIEPEAEERHQIAIDLGIKALKKLRFSGELDPTGKSDWALTAELGATFVQDCVITLTPVTTRIDEEIQRKYIVDLPEIEQGEIEMPEDDTVEAAPEMLDLHAVMLEALALALPAYPRAAGADLGEANFAAPGVDPMTDADAKPFSGLKSLRDQLENKDK